MLTMGSTNIAMLQHQALQKLGILLHSATVTATVNDNVYDAIKYQWCNILIAS